MVQIISTTLEARYAANDPQINGFWVSDLIDLKAIGQFSNHKKAYEAKAVDPMVCGDLEDVEIELIKKGTNDASSNYASSAQPSALVSREVEQSRTFSQPFPLQPQNREKGKTRRKKRKGIMKKNRKKK